MNDWKQNLLETDGEILDLIRATRTIAVLGIKPESHAGQPAYYVPAAMLRSGYQIIPVPTYFPDITEIFGRKVFRKLADIDQEIDMVNVFRRPQDIPAHVDDILACKPKSVWLQLGIRHDEVAETLARAGIKVVQDRCLMVEAGRV